MRRLAAASFAAVLAALPAAARADLFSSVSYGVKVSTIGHGVTLEKPLLYDFSVRVETGTMSVSQQLSYDGVPYRSTNHFNNIAVIGDFRPYGGRYRISGGLVFGSDHIDNIARPETAAIRVGNGVYPVAGTGVVSGRVSYDRPSLYAGVGTGTGIIKGLALTVDAGALVRNGTATANATGPLQSNPPFRADLERFRNEQRVHSVVPVISVGLVYRP
ncbi:MAG TPA: hypothetical protein VK669_14885 [Candidatus Limnocylindrales bacterium]|nr:hypothetical protein [Candidatus Limnocylindrales bacterium]